MVNLVDLVKEFAIYSAVAYPVYHTIFTATVYKGERIERSFLQRLLDKKNLAISGIPAGLSATSTLFCKYVLDLF